jgi:hypothetical protein
VISPKLFKQIEKLIVDNSPVILTAIGVVGTVTTAYLTGKASFEAAEIINDNKPWDTNEYNKPVPESLTSKDKFQLVWKCYIPPVASGASTIAAIICANRISTSRAAALAAAYTLSEKRIGEYKDKMAEKLGVTKEQKARDEIAQERVDAHPVGQSQIIITGTGDVLCYDSPSDRYFRSNAEAIRRVENDINAQVIHEETVPLSDLYSLLKIPAPRFSEEVGWTIEKMLDIQLSTTMSEDNQPCLCIDYAYIPIRGWKSQSEDLG